MDVQTEQIVCQDLKFGFEACPEPDLSLPGFQTRTEKAYVVLFVFFGACSVMLGIVLLAVCYEDRVMKAEGKASSGDKMLNNNRERPLSGISMQSNEEGWNTATYIHCKGTYFLNHDQTYIIHPISHCFQNIFPYMEVGDRVLFFLSSFCAHVLGKCTSLPQTQHMAHMWYEHPVACSFSMTEWLRVSGHWPKIRWFCSHVRIQYIAVWGKHFTPYTLCGFT